MSFELLTCLDQAFFYVSALPVEEWDQRCDENYLEVWIKKQKPVYILVKNNNGIYIENWITRRKNKEL